MKVLSLLTPFDSDFSTFEETVPNVNRQLSQSRFCVCCAETWVTRMSLWVEGSQVPKGISRQCLHFIMPK